MINLVGSVTNQRPIGSNRTRYLRSSTRMMAPLSSSLERSAITRRRRGVIEPWRLITHPKDNDTWGYLTASCQQLAEIQVNREDHLPLRAGAFQDGRICCARQPDFASVNGIMPELVERTNRSDRDAHVGQKPHAS